MVERRNRAEIGVSINYLSEIYDIQDMMDGASYAEELGFDAVWVHDAPLGRRTLAAWDPVTTLSAVAGNTDRVKLGTGIMQPHLRNPISLAKEWATMQEISEGRSLFGVGTGAGVDQLVSREYEALSALSETDPEQLYEDRSILFKESLEIIQSLWRDDKASYDGKFYDFENITLGAANPTTTPPTIMAQGIYFPEEPGAPVEHAWREDWAGRYILGPYKRVAHLGDGWITCTPTPEEYSKCWDLIREELAVANKDPDEFIQAYNCFVNINEDKEQGHENIKEYLRRFHGPPVHDDLVERWGVTGTPDEIIETLDQFVDQGVELFQLVLASPDQFEHMERFSEEILPSF